MSIHIQPNSLALAVTAVSQAMVRRYTGHADLERRYVYTLEACLNHGLKESGVVSFFFGHTRLFDMFVALSESFPNAERNEAMKEVSEARFYGVTTTGRARILIRTLLNKGLFYDWLSNLRYNRNVLDRFYEPGALILTNDEMNSVMNAVEAVARLVHFRFDIKDKTLNEEDYWKKYHSEIITMDLRLVAPMDNRDSASDTPESSAGVRKPLHIEWTEVIFLQHSQAMIRALVSEKQFNIDVGHVQEAQGLLFTRPPFYYNPKQVEDTLRIAQGLLAQRAVSCDSNHFPLKCYASRLAQACLRKSAYEAHERKLDIATEQMQGIFCKNKTWAQYSMLTGAVNDVVGLLKTAHNKLTIDEMKESVCQAQHMLVAKTQQHRYNRIVDAVCSIEPIVRSEISVRRVRVLKETVANVQGLMRSKSVKKKFDDDMANGVLRTQAVIRARSTTYNSLRDASSVCEALVRSRKELDDLHAKKDAAKFAEGLLMTDMMSSRYNCELSSTQMLQAITRSNSQGLVYLLTSLASAWSAGCLVTKKKYNEYQIVKACQISQSFFRARHCDERLKVLVGASRVCQDLLDDKKFHKLEEKKRIEALEKAKVELEMSKGPGTDFVSRSFSPSTPIPSSPDPSVKTVPIMASPRKDEGIRITPNSPSSEAMVTQRPTWVADSDSKVCMRCKRPFSLTNRKHHCRNCGILVDDACIEKRPLPQLGYPKPVIVCKSCIARYYT